MKRILLVALCLISMSFALPCQTLAGEGKDEGNGGIFGKGNNQDILAALIILYNQQHNQPQPSPQPPPPEKPHAPAPAPEAPAPGVQG